MDNLKKKQPINLNDNQLINNNSMSIIHYQLSIIHYQANQAFYFWYVHTPFHLAIYQF